MGSHTFAGQQSVISIVFYLTTGALHCTALQQCAAPHSNCNEASPPVSFVREREASSCWSSIAGDRIGGPIGGAVASCARWTQSHPECSAHFEVDAGNNNWCACGRAGSPNDGCQNGGFHSTSSTYRLSHGEDSNAGNTKVITIPMGKQSVPVTNKKTGKIIAHKTAHFGSIFVGAPVPQEFKVVFDTGSGHLFLPSERCKDEPCLLHKQYVRDSSLSAVDINWDGAPPKSAKRDKVAIHYGTGNVEGDFVREIACLGTGLPASFVDDFPLNNATLPAHCTRFRLITATKMSADPFRQFEFDGVLGLGLKALAVHEEFHFLSAMVGAGDRAVAPIFSVYLGNGEEASEISFGGHNEARMSGPLRWAPVANAELGYWLLNVHGVRIGGEIFEPCADGKCTAIVDTGTSLLGIPKTAATAFHTMTTRAAPLLADDCNMVPGPAVVFDMGGFDLELAASDYTRPGVKEAEPGSILPAKHSAYCGPQVLPVAMEALGSSVFIFGEPMFLKYYTSYDAENKLIGFAPAKTMPDSEAAVTV